MALLGFLVRNTEGRENKIILLLSTLCGVIFLVILTLPGADNKKLNMFFKGSLGEIDCFVVLSQTIWSKMVVEILSDLVVLQESSYERCSHYWAITDFLIDYGSEIRLNWKSCLSFEVNVFHHRNRRHVTGTTTTYHQYVKRTSSV